MKKYLFSFIVIFSLVSIPLHTAPKGTAAFTTAQVAQENQWQNWVFAFCTAITATGAIYLVSLNHGKAEQDSSD